MLHNKPVWSRGCVIITILKYLKQLCNCSEAWHIIAPAFFDLLSSANIFARAWENFVRHHSTRARVETSLRKTDTASFYLETLRMIASFRIVGTSFCPKYIRCYHHKQKTPRTHKPRYRYTHFHLSRDQSSTCINISQDFLSLECFNKPFADFAPWIPCEQRNGFPYNRLGLLSPF